MSDNFRSGNLTQGYPLGMLTKQQAISADATLVDPSGYSKVELLPDSATATSRTISLVDGQYEGQMVVLANVVGSSYTVELLNTGNVKLQYAWYPLQDDTLTLVWSVYRGKWVEVGRTMQSQLLSVSLTADNQVITPLGNTYVEITSDNTTASARTFTIAAGLYDGQRLCLVLVSGTSTTAELADSGTVKLSAAWTPLQDDSLTLVYSTSRTAWIELARSDN